MSLLASSVKATDFLLFAIENLSYVGCQQRPNILLTLFSPSNCRGRTTSRAEIGIASKILAWLEQHFLNGNPALAVPSSQPAALALQ